MGRVCRGGVSRPATTLVWRSGAHRVSLKGLEPHSLDCRAAQLHTQHASVAFHGYALPFVPGYLLHDFLRRPCIDRRRDERGSSPVVHQPAVCDAKSTGTPAPRSPDPVASRAVWTSGHMTRQQVAVASVREQLAIDLPSRTWMTWTSASPEDRPYELRGAQVRGLILECSTRCLRVTLACLKLRDSAALRCEFLVFRGSNSGHGS